MVEQWVDELDVEWWIKLYEEWSNLRATELMILGAIDNVMMVIEMSS